MSLRFQLLGIEYPLPGTNVPKFKVPVQLGIEYPLPGTNVPKVPVTGIEYPLPGTNVPKFPVTGDIISLTCN